MRCVDDIDLALTALADGTRRRVVELLIEAPRRTNEIAELLDVSVPAVSRHLRVLREKQLVERVDVDGDGRGREYRLDPSLLHSLARWLDPGRWAGELSATVDDPDDSEFLGRTGRFLDAFAQSDVAFFERHLAADVELIFAGSSRRWDKPSTIDGVEDHAPYVAWDIADATVRALSADLTVVTVTAGVRTATEAEPAWVVQSMVFDDATDPWTLRHLHRSPTERP